MSKKRDDYTVQLVDEQGEPPTIELGKQVGELTVRELLGLLHHSHMPPPFAVCANFSGYALGTQFPSGSSITVNTIQFDLFYSGGARISPWPTYPGTHFLEMVEDRGSVIVTVPVPARRIDLHIIQAGPDPIDITYYAGNGNQVGAAITTQKDTIEHITLTGAGLTTVKMGNPELLIKEVCYV